MLIKKADVKKHLAAKSRRYISSRHRFRRKFELFYAIWHIHKARCYACTCRSPLPDISALRHSEALRM